MSKRYLSNASLLSVLPAFVLGIGVCGVVQAAAEDASVPPAQAYADQVLPAPSPSDDTDVPITAPLLTPPTQSGSASLAGSASPAGKMMAQGMKAALQAGGKTAVAAVTVPASTAHVLVPPASASVSQPAPVAPAEKKCDQDIQKWEKTCGEAGYPATYVGRIVGETRTSCTDSSLHDVWVTNSCAAPDTLSAKTAKTDAVCGSASNDEFDVVPSANLCAQGTASAVSGDGPWTWACSGINGGTAAACVGHKRVPLRNGSCGEANGAAVSRAPSSDLCAVGVPTTVSGSGPWTWTCLGSGKGSTASCIAPVVVPSPVSAVPVPVVSAPKPDLVPDEPQVAALSPVAATSEKGELCGAASETLAYEAPEKDLCRVGVASVVNGDGPWTWSCTDNEGTSSTCNTLSLKEPAASVASPAASVTTPSLPSAPRATVPAHVLSMPAPRASDVAPSVAMPKFACGPSADLPTKKTPVAGLCEKGASSTVRGTGPWEWSCGKGAAKVSCEAPKLVDASCGSANGMALKMPPSFGLCAEGGASIIEGNGPWTWSCKGVAGGSSASCAASVQTVSSKVDGACGAANGLNLNDTPVKGLCASGVPSAVNASAGLWTWACSGIDEGAVASCSANKITPPKPPGPLVNGLCGASNGAISAVRPTHGLCAAGTLTSIVGNGPWNWDCIGENGGMTVSCTTPMEPPEPVSGACGSASGVSTAVAPQSGLCVSGISGAVNGNGPWTWTCSGVNGGSPASCLAPVTGKTSTGKMGGIPSLMTTSSVPAPPVGLVTPHLPPVEKSTLPRLTLSPAFTSAPVPAQIPPVAAVRDNNAPAATPVLPEGVLPLQPPTFQSALSGAPALQDFPDIGTGLRVPAAHLTLDPSFSVVLFEHGIGAIDKEMTERLDKLADLLLANPTARISLYAYADNEGMTPRDARHLSLNRALALQAYLAARGIAQSRVDIHAEGANTQAPMDRVDIKVNN